MRHQVRDGRKSGQPHVGAAGFPAAGAWRRQPAGATAGTGRRRTGAMYSRLETSLRPWHDWLSVPTRRETHLHTRDCLRCCKLKLDMHSCGKVQLRRCEPKKPQAGLTRFRSVAACARSHSLSLFNAYPGPGPLCHEAASGRYMPRFDICSGRTQKSHRLPASGLFAVDVISRLAGVSGRSGAGGQPDGGRDHRQRAPAVPRVLQEGALICDWRLDSDPLD